VKNECSWLWRDVDRNGVECCIAEDQWQRHVAKRPEIADALDLTIKAMVTPTKEEPDCHRADEPRRRFRLLAVQGKGRWSQHWLRVSVKLVRQPDGRWIKFYQSC